MTLWLIFGLMTAVAIFAVIWPVTRNRTADRSGSDIVVYRDQLAEVERDLAAGLIGKTEAQTARVEISRRLLAAADANQATKVQCDPAAAVRRRRMMAVVSLLLLPVGAVCLYLQVGSPELASTTLAAEQNVSTGQQPSIQALVAKAEAHLQLNPKDGHGWEVLAPVYMQLGRYTDAVNAWNNALQLLGEDADREANLGEALTAEANDIVTADAKSAFERSVALDRTTVSARYYLGLAAEQDGQRDKAAKIWRDLVAEAPADAHWVNSVRTALARVEGKAPAAPTASTSAQGGVAQQQPEQSAMIRSMVDRLAARLKEDGSDPDQWVKLVRSYKVLGETDKAQSAIADAQRALAGDPSKLQKLNAALKELEVDNKAPAAPTPSTSAQGGVAQQQPEQSTMIRSMVDRLAARLKEDGSDPDQWVRLVRSYKVLGEADKAQSAITDAQRALASDPSKLQKLNAALKELEVNNSTAATPSPSSTTAAGAPPDHGQGAVIESMVERLAERLKKSGSDPQGWLMLTRSYLTLGEKEKATAAIKDARRELAGDPGKLSDFNDALKHYHIDE